jgi:hypothetical protein
MISSSMVGIQTSNGKAVQPCYTPQKLRSPSDFHTIFHITQLGERQKERNKYAQSSNAMSQFSTAKQPETKIRLSFLLLQSTGEDEGQGTIARRLPEEGLKPCNGGEAPPDLHPVIWSRLLNTSISISRDLKFPPKTLLSQSMMAELS